MSAQELEVVNSIIRAIPLEAADDDWPARRKAMEDGLAAFPLPPEIERKETKAGGVPAEWSFRAGVASDKVLLYLHGGGYCAGSVKTHRVLTAEIAKTFAGRVLSLDYRLAPEHPYPAAVEDAVAAYKHLLDTGSKPSHLAIAGDSAGGGLTLATLVALRDRGLPLPACAWGLSPWTDLSGTSATMKTKAESDLMVSRDSLLNYAKAYAPTHANDGLASPIKAKLNGLPPLLIQVGSAEVLLDDSTVFTQRAAAADVDVRLEVWPHMPHVFQIFAPMLSEARDAVASASAWMNKHLAS